jgi:glycosyltransferase involved in cell wall biosynthesis
MNICLVSREYPTDDHTGGIGTYTEKTARALARLGQTVSVITEAQDEPGTRVENGVSVVRLARTSRPRVITRAWAVARAIDRLPVAPDIVQACEYQAEGVWYALRPRRGTIFVTRFATPSFLVRELNSHAEMRRAFQIGGMRTAHYHDRLERLQTRRSDAIISISNALADVVSQRWHIPRRRLTTIMNGVDFAERYASQAADLPEELYGKEYLLYFGRLEERKGVHVLARALPAVLEKHPQLHVVFAGNDLHSYMGGSMQRFVEQCNEPYRDRLHFLPRLPQPQLYPLLTHALFAVLPSLWEALGNVSLEALDMGKPVVATLGSGFGEVIDDGVSGLLVPPGDVPALQQALLFLLADRNTLSRMSRAAKARADLFSLDRMALQLLHFYESLPAVTSGVPSPAASVADDHVSAPT